MSVRCKYCDSPIPDNAEFCPNCGAKRPQESEPDTPQAARNSASARYAKPRTIEELRTFCAEKGMSLEKMRFFIPGTAAALIGIQTGKGGRGHGEQPSGAPHGAAYHSGGQLCFGAERRADPALACSL